MESRSEHILQQHYKGQQQHGRQKIQEHYASGYNMVDSDGLPQQTTMQASYEPAAEKLHHQHQHEQLKQEQQHGKKITQEESPSPGSTSKCNKHYASGYNMVDSDGLPQQTTMQASYEPAAEKLQHQYQHEHLQQHNEGQESQQQQHGKQNAQEHYANGYNMVDSDGLPQQTTMQASYEPAAEKLQHQYQHEHLQQNNKGQEPQQQHHGKQKAQEHYTSGYNMVDSDGLPQQTTMQASYEPAAEKLQHQYQHEQLQQHNKGQEPQQQHGKLKAQEHYASGYNMVDSDGLPQQTTMQASYEPAAQKLQHQHTHEQLQQHNREQQQDGKQIAPEGYDIGHAPDSPSKYSKHYASGYNMVDSDGLPQQTTMQASYEPAAQKLQHQNTHEQLQQHNKEQHEQQSHFDASVDSNISGGAVYGGYHGVDSIGDGLDAVTISERNRRTNSSQARDNVILERERRQQGEERQRQSERDPNYKLSDKERQDALQSAETQFKALISEINHMPMGTETLRMRLRKEEIEKELKLLETDIRVFTKTQD